MSSIIAGVLFSVGLIGLPLGSAWLSFSAAHSYAVSQCVSKRATTLELRRNILEVSCELIIGGTKTELQ